MIDDAQLVLERLFHWPRQARPEWNQGLQIQRTEGNARGAPAELEEKQGRVAAATVALCFPQDFGEYEYLYLLVEGAAC